LISSNIGAGKATAEQSDGGRTAIIKGVRKAAHTPNAVARFGLDPPGSRSARVFVQKSFRLGDIHGRCCDKALAIAAAIEDGEITRKTALRQ
jgi:hypothetical protein